VLEGVQEVDTVLVSLEDGLLFIAPRGDMIDSAGILDAQGTGHGMEHSTENQESQTL
jgi:hypothetical protein